MRRADTLQAIETVNTTWRNGPLSHGQPGNSHSYGVAYHLVEVFMEELRHEMKDDSVEKDQYSCEGIPRLDVLG